VPGAGPPVLAGPVPPRPSGSGDSLSRMLWVLLCAAIVLVSLVALALAALRTWRQSVELTRALGRASDAVSGAGEGLRALPQPGSRAGSAPASPAGAPSTTAPTAATPAEAGHRRLVEPGRAARGSVRSWDRR
jgi:hypothetical protein